MSLEVQAAQCADGASNGKTNLCICAPPYIPTGAAKQLVQQHIDVEQQQPWQQQACPPCGRPADALVRPANLRNTKCLYFDQPGGCKWGNSCLFLHDEEPGENVVFHDAPWTAPDIDYYASWVPDGGYYQPVSGPPSVKVEDVRVFFGNVPQSESEARVRELVEPLGEIVLIDIQPTKLHNRRCSGFIHMTSLAAAEAAVEKINATVIGRANLYANIKSHKILYTPLPGWDPSLMYTEPAHLAAQGVDDDSTSAELQVGRLPTLLEVDEEAIDASEVSPVSVVAADLSAVPAFGLK